MRPCDFIFVVRREESVLVSADPSSPAHKSQSVAAAEADRLCTNNTDHADRRAALQDGGHPRCRQHRRPHGHGLHHRAPGAQQHPHRGEPGAQGRPARGPGRVELLQRVAADLGRAELAMGAHRRPADDRGNGGAGDDGGHGAGELVPVRAGRRVPAAGVSAGGPAAEPGRDAEGLAMEHSCSPIQRSICCHCCHSPADRLRPLT